MLLSVLSILLSVVPYFHPPPYLEYWFSLSPCLAYHFCHTSAVTEMLVNVLSLKGLEDDLTELEEDVDGESAWGLGRGRGRSLEISRGGGGGDI